MRRTLIALVLLGLAFVAQAAPVAGSARLVSNGSDFLATWYSNRNGTSVIMSERVAPDGTPDRSTLAVLGPTSRLVSDDAPFPESPLPVSAAFGEEFYLVAWQHEHTIVARRVTRDGVPLDFSPIVLGSGNAITDQAIAWNGAAFLVVWEGDGITNAAFVSEQGEVSGAAAVASYASPRIVWDGRYFLLTCMVEHYYGPPFHSWFPDAIGLVRLDAAGTRLDRDDFGHLVQIDAADPRWHVATSGRESVIVVTGRESLFADVDQDTRAITVHMAADGIALERPQTLFAWFGDAVSDVTWTGDDYVAAIRYTSWLSHSRSWIAAARFQPGRDAAITFAEVGDGRSAPAIASDASGTVLISFDAMSDTDGTVRTTAATALRSLPPLPQAPTITAAVRVGSSLALQWDEGSPDAAGFIIERAWSETQTVPIAIANGDARSTAIEDRSPAIRLRAFNAAGMSEPSGIFTVGSGRRRAAH